MSEDEADDIERIQSVQELMKIQKRLGKKLNELIGKGGEAVDVPEGSPKQTRSKERERRDGPPKQLQASIHQANPPRHVCDI